MSVKINTSDTTVQTVTITPDAITPPSQTIPVEQYVQQLTNQQANLQTQLDKVTAKLQELTDAGVDVGAIQTKLSQKSVGVKTN